MSVMTLVKAINNALDIKLNENKDVVIYGEDVGYEGGVFRVTQGLQEKYGAQRVFDSPLAESGIVGTAVGMAVAGMKPVIEMQFSGFAYPGFNHIISHVSRMRNRSRGKYTSSMVIRMPYGGGIKALEHHSESMEAIYGHIPGLKVVMPSTPHDAKGLLISAIESQDPVIYMEPKRIYRAVKQEVSEDKFNVQIGKANVVQQGKDVTVVSYGAMMRDTQKALALAKKAGISVELIDLRTIFPLDVDTIASSIKKTGRIVTVHEAPNSFGVASEINSIALEESFLHLEAPPKRVTGFDTIFPLPQGEHHYMPTPEKIYYEIEKTVKF
ncbi:MAG: alpha-ketoacid dehydrogenase subunit beta [Bacteroidales bacterium]|nr:alpha-ketoacid dehydrogenase subunit beta [Bacteroidales bacterium]